MLVDETLPSATRYSRKPVEEALESWAAVALTGMLTWLELTAPELRPAVAATVAPLP
jgi:hypothetical protein